MTLCVTPEVYYLKLFLVWIFWSSRPKSWKPFLKSFPFEGEEKVLPATLTLFPGSWRFPLQQAFQADGFQHPLSRPLSCFYRHEAFLATVLWHTESCLQNSLSPVPSSTFAPGVFPSWNCDQVFRPGVPSMLFLTTSTVSVFKSPLHTDGRTTA